MSAVAAIQGPSWVVFGWESAVQEGDRTWTTTPESGKVFPVGGYLIGVAGDYWPITSLRHSFVPPSAEKIAVGPALDKFMATRFSRALKRCLDENNPRKSGKLSSQLLVATRGVVYEFGGDDLSQIRDADGLYAIGSGGMSALGALHALETEQEARVLDRSRTFARQALEAAVATATGCRGPVYVTAQERTRKRVVGVDA